MIIEEIIAKYAVDANLFRLGSTNPKKKIQPQFFFWFFLGLLYRGLIVVGLLSRGFICRGVLDLEPLLQNNAGKRQRSDV